MRRCLAVAVVLGMPAALFAQTYSWVRSPVNGHEYAVTNSQLTWVQAEAAAQAVGAHLATIRNAQEQQWIEGQFGTAENTWIGLNDVAVEGTWVWSSGEASPWRNWCPNEPNGGIGGRPDADFVHMAAFPGQCFGPWNDQEANRYYRGLIERAPVTFDWEWSPVAAAPDVRLGATAAFDPDRGVAVVAGGTFAFPNTQEWDGRVWRTIPGSPFAFMSAALAFDGTSVIAVAGGATWRWDGASWTDLQVATTPQVARTALAFDSSRRRVVAFGGGGPFQYSNDTWEWDGATWTLMNPANRPSARSEHALAFDAEHGKVILFGGGLPLPARVRFNDTWEWDGAAWTQRNPTTVPPARSEHSLTSLHGTGLTVLFGGIDGVGILDDLWIWDGDDWNAPNSPTGTPVERVWHAAFPFPGVTGQQVVMYSGADNTGASTTTQVLGSTRPFASYRYRGAGCGAARAPLMTFEGLPAFGRTFSLVLEGAPSYQAVVLFWGFANTFAGQPLPLALDALGMTGCELWCEAIAGEGFVSDPQGRFQRTFQVPIDPALLGLYFNNQYVVRDPSANALGLSATRAGEGVFGR